MITRSCDKCSIVLNARYAEVGVTIYDLKDDDHYMKSSYYQLCVDCAAAAKILPPLDKGSVDDDNA